MKRLLIGILTLSFLLSFCPKMVEVAYAEETVQMEIDHVDKNQKQGAAMYHNPQRDSHDHACCVIHEGSGFIEHPSFQKQLPRNSDDSDSRFLWNLSDVSAKIEWILDDQSRCLFSSPPFFQTNDFERRSEVMRR